MTKENKRMVVMGGSFNPPTLAHFKLMREAIDAIDGWRGVFVPVSDAYLKRKMRRCHPPVVLSPAMRIKMLQSMCVDSRMSVCDKEILKQVKIQLVIHPKDKTTALLSALL